MIFEIEFTGNIVVKAKNKDEAVNILNDELWCPDKTKVMDVLPVKIKELDENDWKE